MTDAVITPGPAVVDDRGEIAQLHGIGVQQIDGRWYAWGEDKTAGQTFTAVQCYSTGDFAQWRFEGEALSVGSGSLERDMVVERPKVLRRPDGKWVMYLHIDSPDYSTAHVGYAVADSPAGPFTFLRSERPMGNESRDIGVYQEDGVGYLLSEDRANGPHIYRLRDDYLGVDGIVTTLKQQERPDIGYESPALVKQGTRYYMFGSDLTGWHLNDNKYSSAERLAGPWSPWADFAPTGSRTHDSQVSVIVPVDAGFVYVGDRWDPSALTSSGLVMLPMTIGDGHARTEWRDTWSLVDLVVSDGGDAR